nr:TonB-dependent receptor [Neptunicella marina]
MAEEAAPANKEETTLEEITVVGRSVSYANNQTDDSMLKQQTALTSALAVIDNLPGVLINEGDTFGSDDWSTTVSIRGFQLSLDEQQIGITIDGIANGNSNYGGGAKANRYIDTENLGRVEVSQGTGDVASRSNEALGGTLNFTTYDPGVTERMTTSLSLGSFDAQKYFVRYETGEIAKDTFAWVSVSSSQNSDWVDQVAENKRDHLAAKVLSNIGGVDFTAYVSWDDTHEDNYQRVSLAQFIQNPESDNLTSEWTGIPYVDQVYRRGWSTLRENLFGYLKASYQVGDLELSGNVYYHHNEGRGDWVPQYVVDVHADGDNQAHSELVSGNTYYGGSALGQIKFVDSNGMALSPIDGCQSSIVFPYGGAGADYDPNCYEDGAVPVGSYRHSHYKKERVGFDADFVYYTRLNGMDNELRGGIWYEDYKRQESRDWHKIIDSKTSYEFDHTPYWVQYDNRFPVTTTMFYAEDELDTGFAKFRLGVKQFFVDLERFDNFGEGEHREVNSDSDLLVSGGVVVQTGIDGLEVFAGYAENFAAIKDAVLEKEASALEDIEPETADNIDAGLRFVSGSVNASITYYDIKFENRLTFISPDSPDGVNYLDENNGAYINVGGIESKGVEASLTVDLSERWSLYGSYTHNTSEYTGGLSDYPEGNQVFGSAKNMAVVSVDYTHGNYFAGSSTKWVDDRYIDAANTQIAPGYVVTDFYAGVAVESPVQGIESINVRMTINNMFDKSYLGGIAGQAAWIGSPRSAALNLSMSF